MKPSRECDEILDALSQQLVAKTHRYEPTQIFLGWLPNWEAAPETTSIPGPEGVHSSCSLVLLSQHRGAAMSCTQHQCGSRFPSNPEESIYALVAQHLEKAAKRRLPVDIETIVIATNV
jgi:hypothetical protein